MKTRNEKASPKELRIGMIGLDTSHCTTFTAMINDRSHPNHVPGGKVVVAFPGGSMDFELSRSRVQAITETLKERYEVKIVNSLEEVAEQCDAILLTSVDGRVHLEQFAAIAPYRKPVYLDKPFALTTADAISIAALSEQYGTPFFTCSAVRYGFGLAEALSDSKETIYGADVSGPMPLQETQNGLFWYGIHCVEALYAIFGTNCLHVKTVSTDDHELIVGTWKCGRIGTVRGNRKGNGQFHAVIHRIGGSTSVDILGANSSQAYEPMLLDFFRMAQEGIQPLSTDLSIEIVRFLEGANESKDRGGIRVLL